MSETAFAPITTMGLDIAKAVFPVHGTDAAGEVMVRRGLSRARVLSFFDSGAKDVGKGGQGADAPSRLKPPDQENDRNTPERSSTSASPQGASYGSR